MELLRLSLHPKVFHNYRLPGLSLAEIAQVAACYKHGKPILFGPLTALVRETRFARTETYYLLDAPPHIASQSGHAPAYPDAGALEARLRKALATVAPLVVDDPAFIPVFERLEQELAVVPDS